eukprot:CAMPEP_0169085838 /NCGR_PEP_ID=MMETSP1015-20121227/13377_1 /TAXON_ID=342587 /ORGANISM="Karlodinium micrum, Strain CCMP2283" /LENGTH=114 /DNA_ID=CAMNT_0009145959 /DNA_START=72 /DNA_END=416 /DNA_ORIENTATION=-
MASLHGGSSNSVPIGGSMSAGRALRQSSSTPSLGFLPGSGSTTPTGSRQGKNVAYRPNSGTSLADSAYSSKTGAQAFAMPPSPTTRGQTTPGGGKWQALAWPDRFGEPVPAVKP